jgi:NRAMP (natural resistance-associated macrophage protein)-like metal ion transporter
MKQILSRFRYHTAIFFAVIGPGFITAVVDNDAGGILTYSQAGAMFGYLPLWTLLPITLLLIIAQEMCSRMGAVTGKGLSDLIREEFGLRVTFITMALLVVVNLTNVMSEFAGVASSLELFGISRFISVPLAAAAVWFLVVKGNYQSVEKIFLFACVFYVTYIISGILVKPDWKEAAIYSVRPVLLLEPSYIYMLIGMVGTTIAPWMQFYLQAAVVEKGVTAKEYAESRIEVVVGCFMTSDRVLYHRGVRGRNLLLQRRQGDQGCGGSRGRTQAVRTVRLPSVQRGALQRVHLRGLHPAALHGVFGLRGSGL